MKRVLVLLLIVSLFGGVASTAALAGDTRATHTVRGG